MRIGIYGGSFNPIHNGHIILGKTMLEAMRLDEVWYMVSPQNPLKRDSGDLAPENDRLHLAKLALKGIPGLKASDYEFRLPRPSYTWNTLQCLEKDYPGIQFVLVIGGDNWACFDKWAHHDDILEKYEVAVFPREGADIDRVNLPVNVTVVDVPLVNVTSTMLRKKIREGKDIRSYVPLAVAREVEKSLLYR